MKTLAIHTGEKELELACRVRPDVPDTMVGDAVRLRQVIVNLVGNALAVRLQALPENRRPPIILLSSSTEPVDVAGRQELGIARCLAKPVKQSDLLAAIEYVLGRRSGDRANPEPAGNMAASLERLRILLAEDNAVNQKIAAKLLERAGHVVTIVPNGRLAAEALDRDRFDLVLMDVQMPVMDGLEASALIRKQERTGGGHVPIVALTAHAMTGDRERCLKAGMDANITKPIRPAELFEVIQSLCGVESNPSN